MDLLVGRELRTLSEADETSRLVALVRPLTCMDEDVLPQVLCRRHLLLAVTALEQLGLAVEGLDVPPQSLFNSVRLHTAWEWTLKAIRVHIL